MPAAAVRTVEEPLYSAGRREDIEEDLTSLGLKWRFNADGSISDIDMTKSLANQARLGEPLNEERVETYKEAIRNGAKMPALVVDFTGRKRKGIIMDGNHRAVASAQADYDIFARYEVVEGDAAAITLYTFRANTKHGLPNALEDRIEHAIWLIESGVSQAAALKQLQVPRTAFHKAWYRHLADRRADEAGIDRTLWDALPGSSRSRLQNIKADETFIAAATLAQRANLGHDEVQELVAELNSTTSINKQTQIIEARTAAYTDRIQAQAGGVLARGKSKKPMTPKQRWAIALGSIAALPEPATVAKQLAGAERAEYKKRLNAAADKLRTLAKEL